jgi:hypothetical protein
MRRMSTSAERRPAGQGDTRDSGAARQAETGETQKAWGRLHAAGLRRPARCLETARDERDECRVAHTVTQRSRVQIPPPATSFRRSRPSPSGRGPLRNMACDQSRHRCGGPRFSEWDGLAQSETPRNTVDLPIRDLWAPHLEVAHVSVALPSVLTCQNGNSRRDQGSKHRSLPSP